MVGLEHDQCIFSKPGFLKLSQNPAHHIVGPTYGTVVLGDLLADGRQIGKKAGDDDFIRLVDS